MRQRNHVELDTRLPNIRVRITWVSGRFNMTLRGYPIDSRTGTRVDGVKVVSRTARTNEEIEFVQQQIRDTITDKLRKKSTRTLRDDEVVEGLDSNEPMVIAFEELVHSDALTYIWSDATIRLYVSKCRKFILTSIQHCKNPEDFTQNDYDQMHQNLVQSILDNGRSYKNLQNATSGANTYVSAFITIYSLMRERYPDLPDIQFFREMKTVKTKAEQIKSLPLPVRIAFRNEIERLIDEMPIMARSIALMESGALRTSEAAATIAKDMTDNDTYIVINVRFQEINGLRNPQLKTKSSKRKVVLDEWGTYVIQLTNSIIGDYEDTDKAPITSRELSEFIKKLLKKCGCDDAYMESQKKVMLANPDYDDNGMPSGDLAAYVLRRACTDKWTNICGYTKSECDYELGHVQHCPKEKKFTGKKNDELKQLATKLQRYDLNPELSNSPKHEAVKLYHGMEYNFEPFDKYQFFNDTDEDLKITMTITPSEPGEAITVIADGDVTARRMPSGKGSGKRYYTQIIGVIKSITERINAKKG